MHKFFILLLVIWAWLVMGNQSALASDSYTESTLSAESTNSASPSADALATGSAGTLNTTNGTEVEAGATPDVDVVLPTGFFSSFSELINEALRLVIVIAVLLTFVYLIWGAFDWITSGGDRGKTEQARSKLTSALLGLIVVAASYAILLIVLNFLGYESLEDLINRLPGA